MLRLRLGLGGPMVWRVGWGFAQSHNRVPAGYGNAGWGHHYSVLLQIYSLNLNTFHGPNRPVALSTCCFFHSPVWTPMLFSFSQADGLISKWGDNFPGMAGEPCVWYLFSRDFLHGAKIQSPHGNWKFSIIFQLQNNWLLNFSQSGLNFSCWYFYSEVRSTTTQKEQMGSSPHTHFSIPHLVWLSTH